MKKPHGFQPGTPKPPGSGSKPGQKYGKTIARENAHVEEMRLIAELSDKYADMTAQEIMDGMKFNPIVKAIVEVMSPHTTEGARVKYIEMLAKKAYGDMSTVKHEGGQVNRLEIVLSNGQDASMFDHFNQPEQIIHSTVVDVTPTVDQDIVETVEVNDAKDDQSNTRDDT